MSDFSAFDNALRSLESIPLARVAGRLVRLNGILRGFDLSGEFVRHPAQLAKLVNFALNLCVAHGNTPFNFRRGVLY